MFSHNVILDHELKGWCISLHGLFTIEFFIRPQIFTWWKIMKKYRTINIIIWIHEISWMWGVEARSTVHKYVNELNKHFAKKFQQSLWDLVFCRHVPIFFIMACNTLEVVYFLVISIQRPPFIFVGWSVAVMMKLKIVHYYLKDTLPFCDCYFHIVSWVNNFQACLVLDCLYIYEC